MRSFIHFGIMVCIICAALIAGLAEREAWEIDPTWKTSDEPVRKVGPPRKVIVGTVIQSFWEKFPPERTLSKIDILVDRVAAESAQKYPGRPLDLIVLPEGAVSLSGKSLRQQAVKLEGSVSERIGARARQYGTYLVVPMLLDEELNGTQRYSNAAVLFDRLGKVSGIYRKVHPVAALHSDILEGGVTPGVEFKVFDCDFGRLGIQICWDLSYEEGWRSLARQGAEIVALPSESPQITRPSYYASKGRYWVVSSTPRHNASIFNPAGMVETQILDGDSGVLVHEIDLAFLVLPWANELEEGRALSRVFGDRVGFRYYPSEDKGVFWSNDPELSISQMAHQLGLVEFDWHVERTRRLQDRARKVAPKP